MGKEFRAAVRRQQYQNQSVIAPPWRTDDVAFGIPSFLPFSTIQGVKKELERKDQTFILHNARRQNIRMGGLTELLAGENHIEDCSKATCSFRFGQD